ncbi:STAS/SEC14 domain-containing protein [Pontibacter vulgaris]|uniref:STAS/SEC14 domain-containing protein n=1 Tax=Pontibacter vulgaris TaxID=2905679 RepID=UPI001FA6B5B8|nr:STAS/SEC14 domain-containing protein [Pontibacter vulgaris]
MKKEISNAFGKIFLTIEYIEKNNLTHNNWLGYQTLDGIMLGADQCIDVISFYKCPYLLNDNRLVVGPWDHALEWIANNWTPRAIKAGLTHFAHVVSPESFAALSAEAMNAKIGDSFQMQIFGDFDEAKKWLLAAQQEKEMAV